MRFLPSSLVVYQSMENGRERCHTAKWLNVYVGGIAHHSTIQRDMIMVLALL
jgi:hypothetical protein